MKNLRTHLDKIRSDAAECMLLSKLAPEGKGEMFAKTAEHLNALAFELEKTIATNSADTGARGEGGYAARAGDRQEAVVTNAGAAHHLRAARPRRMLALLLVIILGVIVGAFWSNKPAKEYWSLAKEYWSLYASQSKNETSPAPQDQTTQAIAAHLSGERAERKILMEQLIALAARVDNLATAVDNLKTARVEIEGQSNKQSVGAEEKPAISETKSSAPEEKSAREENPTSPSESLAAAKQSGGALAEPVDRVGAIPVAPRRAELDPHNSAVGPRGCTQFRSFDPVSGTYTAFDGRRRQCRQ